MAAIALSVRAEHVADLRALVGRFPELSLEAAGKVFSECVVRGPDAQMAAFKPHLHAWQVECENREGW